MKHLRRFNEGLDDGDGLKEYCEMNLAYLMDDGFNTYWTRIYNEKDPNSETWLVSIRKPIDLNIPFQHHSNDLSNYEVFKWGDVKDQIIRFVDLIGRNYDLLSFTGILNYSSEKKFRVKLSNRPILFPNIKDFTLQELENLDDDFLITQFSLNIVDKI